MLQERKRYDDRFSKTTLRCFEGTARGRLVQDIIKGVRQMINVSKPAQEQVRMYFEGKEITPIRILLNSAGCGGPSLAMALDEKQNTDAVFTFDDVEYIMDKNLLEKASPVDIDFAGTGFRLESGLKPVEGCKSCSGGTCGT